MKINNELNYQFDFDLNKIFKKILNLTIKETNKQPKEFFVNFVNEKEIKDINKKYRQKNSVTDVISFRFDDNGMYNPIQGEMYICIEQAIKQANEYNHSVIREVCFLFLHGLLHLLGYDHINKDEEKIMFELQEKILNKLNINR